MAERGQRLTLRVGRVEAEVSLLKTSAKPREAQHETRRVPVPVPEAESPAGDSWPDELAAEVADSAPPAETYAGRVATDPLVPEGVVAVVGGERLDPFGAEPDPEPEAPREDPFPLPGGIAGGVMDGTYDAGGPPAEVVQSAIRHGVTNEAGEFVDLTEELAAIDERCILDGMEVAATVRQNAIPAHRVRDAHFVAPAGEGAPKVLALLWAGLRERRAAAMVRWTKRTNQALGALVARGTAEDPYLVLLELEWTRNLRPLPARARLGVGMAATSDQERRAAARLVAAYAEKPAILETLRDERAAQRAELLEAARAGEAWTAPALAAPPREADDLADLMAAGRR